MQDSQTIEEASDQQLVELAGKAISYVIVPHIEERMHSDSQVMYRFAVQTPFGLKAWNPLIDDAHAFHLAVKLKIQITPGTYNNEHVTAFSPDGFESVEHPSFSMDEFASTRRAIVRVAAEVGRAMRN
jgi:hypothetical protein